MFPEGVFFRLNEEQEKIGIPILLMVGRNPGKNPANMYKTTVHNGIKTTKTQLVGRISEPSTVLSPSHCLIEGWDS